MTGVNKVILVGNVGHDPEVKTLQAGGKAARFSLATSETWKDRGTGERKERTEWHSVVVFLEPLVDVIEKYVRKGSKLYVEGKLRTRKWTDKNGVEKYTTEVTLAGFGNELVLLDKTGSGKPDFPEDDGYGAPAPREENGHRALDDEIPF